MGGASGQSATDRGGASQIPINEMPKSEKINFYFRDMLRIYPDQISIVIKSFQDWAKQFK